MDNRVAEEREQRAVEVGRALEVRRMTGARDLDDARVVEQCGSRADERLQETADPPET